VSAEERSFKPFIIRLLSERGLPQTT